VGARKKQQGPLPLSEEESPGGGSFSISRVHQRGRGGPEVSVKMTPLGVRGIPMERFCGVEKEGPYNSGNLQGKVTDATYGDRG